MSENIENKAVRGSISQIILKALSNGDRYGYEICKDIEKLTNGRLILKQPSLYSSLRRMEEQDLISSYWKDSLIGGRRHYYSLTNKGKEFFEESKKNWQDDESLLNNLPQKDFDQDNSSSSLLNEESPSQPHFASVINQENLFNLNRNVDKEIKKIDAQKEEQEDEFNKSFFQFDFFEQNIKFVKENSKQKQEVSAFTNKFSGMDNHKEEIEPEKQPRFESVSAFAKKQAIPKDSSENLSTSTARTNFENYENKTISQPVLKNIHQKIERHEVYKTYNENLDALRNFEIKTSLLQSDLTAKNTSKQEKDDLKPVENFNNDRIESVTLQSVEGSKDASPSKQPLESITWDFETNVADNNALFEGNDYKDVIGKLYNNSRLQDPYEQNKFQTFKEIFPSSQYSVKANKLAASNVDIEENAMTIEAKNRIDSYLKSSEDSNIDCEDIKKLNSLYNLQGIEIKIHTPTENKKTNKTYTDKNKLNMVSSWVNSAIMLLELLFVYLILNGNNLIVGKQPFIYFLGVVVTLSYCIISTLENIFDRFRLIVIEKPFNKTFMQRLFCFILISVFIFALNIVFGMTSLLEVNYLSYWLVPLLLSSNLLVSCLIYYLLLKSKNFDS